MGVYLDVGTRLERSTAEAALNEARQMWRVAGDDIGSGLSRAISLALGKIDGSGARRTLQELAAEHERLARGADETGRIMERNARNVEIAQRRLLDITGGVADASVLGSTKMAKAERDLADAQAISTRSAREHADAVVAASAAHDKLDSAAKTTASSVGTMAAVANGVGVASIVGLGAAMAATTKTAGDFQQGMTKMSAAADMPADQMVAIGEGILKMAGQVGYSAGELQNAMFMIQKSSLTGANGAATAAEKLDVLKAAAQGATIEQAPLEHVIDAVTQSLNDFDLPADQAANVMAKLRTATGESKVSLDLFAGSMHNIEPLAKTMGVSIDEVYGLTARLTQSGTSPDQATQNLAQTMRNFAGPSNQMRDALGKLHLSASQLQTEMSDPSVGLRGVLEQVATAIRDQVGPSGKVAIDTFYQNADATRALKEGYTALTPASKALADQINSGTTPSLKVLHEQALSDPKLAQWLTMRQHVEGLSQNLRKLQPDLETVQQMFKDATGGAETLNVVSQLVGTPEDIEKTKKAVDDVAKSTKDAAGNVPGFTETQANLNAKMNDARAAFSAAAIELGTVFIPVMSDVANIAKDVGEFLAQNPELAHLAADAMVGLAGAWTLWKIASSDAVKAAISGLGSVMEKLGLTKTASDAVNTSLAEAGPAAMRGSEGVATATATEIREENAVADAAERADAAMAGGAAGGGKAKSFLKTAGDLSIVGLIADQVGDAGQWVQDQLKGVTGVDKSQELWKNIGFGAGSGWAGGGPVGGSGPRGVDSVAAWLAPGEHVLTAGDVDAMGGHAGVYAFRNALHRAGGGPADGGMLGFDQALLSNVPSGRYSQTGAADLTKGLADCSSAVEGLVHIMDGEAIPAMRQMSTGNEAQWLTAHGFLPGMGGPGDFRVGFNSEHTQATLPGGTPFNWGSDAAAARRGIGGTGAYDPAFTQHFYRPVGAEGMGMDGYYTPNPERVAKVEEEIRHKNDDIHDLEEKLGELKSNAKQSERDRIQHEIDHAKDELKDLNGKLAEAQRGTFHRGRTSLSSRGGGAGSGGMQFGAPLPDRMGLDKGIPGFFEWLTTLVADLAIGPIEGAMLGNYLRSGGMGDVADAVGLPDGAGGFGDIANAVGIPTTALTGAFGGSGGSPAGSGSGSSGGGSGGSSGGSGGGSTAASSWWAPGSKSSGGPSSTWWAPGYKPAPAAPATPFSYKNPDGSYPPGFIGPMIIDPARGLSAGDIAGIHGDSGIPGAPMFPAMNPHIPPADAPLPPNTIPQKPGGGVDFDAIRRGLPQGPLDMTSRPFSVGQYKDMYPQHFATGGPVGTDTIPAWLSPGEMVMNAQATKNNLAALQFMNAPHYDSGTQQPVQPGQGQQPKPTGPPQPQGSKPQQGQPHLTGSASPGPGNLKIPGGADTHPGLATPGADTQQFGEGLPASSGIGFGGGLIGAAEQAAAGAAGAAGGAGGAGAGAAAGMAMNMAFQIMNRTAGYVGQLGGIAAEGILSTLLPADSPLSNFSNTLPGKLVAGVAGVRPGQPNSAGKTEAPMKSQGLEERSREGSGGGDTHHHGVEFNGPVTVQANNPQEFHQQMSRDYSAARAAYPTNMP